MAGDAPMELCAETEIEVVAGCLPRVLCDVLQELLAGGSRTGTSSFQEWFNRYTHQLGCSLKLATVQFTVAHRKRGSTTAVLQSVFLVCSAPAVSFITYSPQYIDV
jgi:hypothetical protein